MANQSLVTAENNQKSANPESFLCKRINSEQYPSLKEKLRAVSQQVAKRNRRLYKELENA